jgi:3',5'-cyclic-AMP phosphodiesterase
MNPIRVVQVTDPHLFGDRAETLRGLETLRSLEQTLAAAAVAIARCDVVLVTGDLVQDDPAGYQHFPRLFGSLGKPIWCIPGNHDDARAMRSVFNTPPFRLGGHADFGAWRIVMLDSAVPNDAAGHLSARELRELEAALAGAPTRPTLVCLHHHPIPMHSRWLDEVGLKNGDELFAILDRHPQVRCVSWGHVHQAHDTVRNGVRLVATPSTCGQFLPHAEEFAMDKLPPAYRELTLHADGTLDTQLHFVG